MGLRRAKPTAAELSQAGFSLLETLGALAVTAILVAVLVPKIFAAIGEARINHAVGSLTALQSAAVTYVKKYGRVGGVGGSAYPAGTTLTNWDAAVLVVEQLIEQPFRSRLGGSAQVVVRDCAGSGTAPDGAKAAYDLDGNPSLGVNDAVGDKIVECTLQSVSREDAWELSRRIDGPALSAADKTAAEDLQGRVKYQFSGSQGTVRIYLVHK